MDPTVKEKSASGQLHVIDVEQSSNEESAVHQEHHIPLDLDDPHRAALEDNPDKAERLTWTTLLAVIVSELLQLAGIERL